jgi:putative sigma-54 modulation protein
VSRKDCVGHPPEFRDREVFVFRDHAGQVRVLHRKKDGKMELIEVP